MFSGSQFSKYVIPPSRSLAALTRRPPHVLIGCWALDVPPSRRYGETSERLPRRSLRRRRGRRLLLFRQLLSSPLVRAKSSILFHSSALSWSFSAAMFSSRCPSDDVPGIGNMTGDFCSNQASASCTTLTL